MNRCATGSHQTNQKDVKNLVGWLQFNMLDCNFGAPQSNGLLKKLGNNIAYILSKKDLEIIKILTKRQ